MLLRIDENLEIDVEFITCSEYQIFINHKFSLGENFIPEHWLSAKFPIGSSKEPVTGISYNDAEEFCKWISANNLIPGASFRLPTAKEIEHIEKLEKSKDFLGCWCNDNGEGRIEGLSLEEQELVKETTHLAFKSFYNEALSYARYLSKVFILKPERLFSDYFFDVAFSFLETQDFFHKESIPKGNTVDYAHKNACKLIQELEHEFSLALADMIIVFEFAENLLKAKYSLMLELRDLLNTVFIKTRGRAYINKLVQNRSRSRIASRRFDSFFKEINNSTSKAFELAKLLRSDDLFSEMKILEKIDLLLIKIQFALSYGAIFTNARYFRVRYWLWVSMKKDVEAKRVRGAIQSGETRYYNVPFTKAINQAMKLIKDIAAEFEASFDIDLRRVKLEEYKSIHGFIKRLTPYLDYGLANRGNANRRSPSAKEIIIDEIYGDIDIRRVSQFYKHFNNRIPKVKADFELSKRFILDSIELCTLVPKHYQKKSPNSFRLSIAHEFEQNEYLSTGALSLFISNEYKKDFTSFSALISLLGKRNKFVPSVCDLSILTLDDELSKAINFDEKFDISVFCSLQLIASDMWLVLESACKNIKDLKQFSDVNLSSRDYDFLQKEYFEKSREVISLYAFLSFVELRQSGELPVIEGIRVVKERLVE